jgi:predicted RNase H-like nuclease (RuvC/YqgF family)
VVSALKALEDELRERGILPELASAGVKEESGSKFYDKAANKSLMDAQRVAQLESLNHDLKVRVTELEKEIEVLRSKLASSRETVEAVGDGLSVFLQCPS